MAATAPTRRVSISAEEIRALRALQPQLRAAAAQLRTAAAGLERACEEVGRLAAALEPDPDRGIPR